MMKKLQYDYKCMLGADSMSRRMLLIAIGVIMVAISYWYTLLGTGTDTNINKPSSAAGTGVKVGQTLTPFTLESLDGSQVTVGRPGKITVINFWATWCPPCQEEMPELEIFAHDNQEKVDFYAINLKESNGKIKEFISKNNYTMRILLDTDGAIGKNFQVTGIPTTIIINKHGMVKFRKSGGMTRNELEGIINSL